MLTVPEALEILKKEGITESEQMVRRWLRQKKIKGKRTEYRKEGWEVNRKSLERFIHEKKPELAARVEIQRLKERINELEKENHELKEMLESAIASNTKLNQQDEEQMDVADDSTADCNVTIDDIKDFIDEENDNPYKETILSVIRSEFPKYQHEDRDLLEEVRDSLFKVKLETNRSGKFICPARGPRFRYKTAESLIRALIPVLIDSKKARRERIARMKAGERI